ncbi:uncharacterized protein KY384_006189 [Bacidia gigantensis]|uniref:uncharacterized protein n=1 Tax=Bacidia gigantensis TaxID=2732470 RepID=UPI001D0410A8|nr:uncharacterized protein KY384_006189 [Bacidia gigantensis]KAG8529552.1 hypothetical protein KY384_006189 [Bacidia gigantensis]
MGSSGIDIKVFRGSKDSGIVETSIPQPDLKGDEALVKITHSGLCGTDLHYLEADLVLGHEGVGIVQEIGPGVRHLKKGDRVGFGYVHSTCGHCLECFSGKETYCPERVMYGLGDFENGSFSSHAVWSESFLFLIPPALQSGHAAPLQCGGATVFNALEGYDTRPTERVGIIGIGGLGHLAIEFAAKMGCEVVVFSSTDSKKEEAMRLGATEFVATKDAKKLDVKPLSRLVVTTSQMPDWEPYIPILAPGAKIFPLTVSMGNFEFPQMPMITQGITVQGTVVAPRSVHMKMLDFCAMHGIKPVTQEFPLTKPGIEDALEHLTSGKMRYRGVLVAQG